MSAYLDLILLLVVVLLIFNRLRQVLGTKPEKPQLQIKILSPKEFTRVYGQALRENAATDADSTAENVPLSPLDRTLQALPNFSKSDFYRRCGQAFEMILKAFASADEKTLKMLLTPKMFSKFQEIIAQRQNEGISAETDLIRLEDMSIEKADISPKGVARIVVRFVSEQINLLKNAAGEVIEGDENFVQKITDVWTFERNLNKSSPAWLLSSTKKKEA